AAHNVRLGATKIADAVGLVEAVGFQMTSEKALSDPIRADVIADYIGRWRKMQEWAVAHGEEWARKYAELTKLPLDVARETFRHYQPHPVPLDDAIEASEQALVDAFVDQKVLPHRVDLHGRFDRRYNERPAAP